MRARMCVPLIKTKEERRARLVPCRMGHDVWANREKETIKAIYIKKKKRLKRSFLSGRTVIVLYV